MIAILALAVLLPQEPPDALQEVLRGNKLMPRVEAILKASRPDKVKYRKIKPPKLLTTLRKAGLSAYRLDLRRQLSGAYEATPTSDFWFEFADNLLLGRRVKITAPKVSTLKDLAKFFSQTQREMKKALDIGKPLDRTAPRLHALMERMQRDRAVYVTTKEDNEMINDEVRLATRVDLAAMWAAAKKIVLLSRVLVEPKTLKMLRAAPKVKVSSLGGVTGDVVMDKEMPWGGRMVIGGEGANEYDCTKIDVIIDLGGDDTYRGPAGGAGELRRYAVCIDLEGNDTYECMNDALGSATYGIGVLIDILGNDTYQATSRSAGFGAAGIGVFVDAAGDDVLKVGAHSAGVGMAGFGICVDLSGTDIQEASDVSFGCGLPAGFGLFLDGRGNDKRTQVRGKEAAYLGMGAARGLRGVVDGGVGVCLDLAGDDTYTAGDLAGGAAEEGGLGIFVDALGDDHYTVRNASLGAARGHSIGVFQDWAGKDTYQAGAMALGFAIRGGRAFCLDQGGDDTYEVNGLGLGMAGEDALAVFWDTKGKDSYTWNRGATGGIGGRVGGRLALGVLFDSGDEKDTYERKGVKFFDEPEGNGKTLWRGDKARLQEALHLFLDSK